MDERLERFRNEAKKVGPGAGRKFPAELRALGSAYAREQRDSGAGWKEIAAALGVTVPTVQRWARGKADSKAEFHAVKLVDEPPGRRYAAVLPGGMRIEGMDLEAVVSLARALS